MENGTGNENEQTATAVDGPMSEQRVKQLWLEDEIYIETINRYRVYKKYKPAPDIPENWMLTFSFTTLEGAENHPVIGSNCDYKIVDYGKVQYLDECGNEVN